MNLKEEVQKAEKEFLEKRIAFSKKDDVFLTNRLTFRNKMLGFLTADYYKRKKLFHEGHIYLAYAFQEWEFHKGSMEHPVWVLFSPSLSLQDNPEILEEIAKKIGDLKGKTEGLTKEEKQLIHYVREPLSRPKYFEIPSSIEKRFPIYLSVTDWILTHISSFHLGYNLIICAPNLSKEIFFLPEKFFPSSYKEGYLKGELLHYQKEKEND